MSSILFSLVSITEKLGIPINIVSNVEISKTQNSVIQVYNAQREIYGTFFCIDDLSDGQQLQITCGPLLMPEVKFGLKEAKSLTQEFKQILKALFILANHYLPETIDDQQLNLEDFYQLQHFSYNSFYDINEYYKLELLLFSHVKDRNKLAAVKTLELFVKYYYKNLSSDQLKCFYCSLITLLARVEIEKGIPVSKVFDQQFHYYQYLHEVRNITAFEALAKQAIHDFLANPTNIPKKNYSSVIVYVLNYIENHMLEAISLKSICDDVSRDSKYVGRLFYKEVGMHFKDFVHLKKIEKAKYFLLFSDKTINQISEELSFSNQSHFSAVFKKIVGLTPYIYQRNRVYYSY
ncbi:AraC family transcriptional regulator [Enterococcus faecium]|uniref:helix-turn-helix domain-containing protein n=1 Tax=Enterococcus faecium TaxID=1352 RepID=UPI0019E96905|nr:helix-turn-helix transcriptional regulator [Enterococcus faecium]MDQ8458936.1 AraC family transcriptional regulator [Enterococcus faecium]MDQ8463890.1 AraC family transcriptional regulator [Enterococcus faecium]MDQ8569285.1 AraC family transcriptional regulator [Enterococcus faecium]HEL7535773.1 helix-turn-helix transcriptional regulator [Enterococcus faecium]